MHTPEDLTEIERAGRRCAIFRSGRRWRQLEVGRPEGQKPVVMCAACRARYGSAPPLPATQQAAAEPVVDSEPAPKERAAPGEDRLRRALAQLPREPLSVGQVGRRPASTVTRRSEGFARSRRPARFSRWASGGQTSRRRLTSRKRLTGCRPTLTTCGSSRPRNPSANTDDRGAGHTGSKKPHAGARADVSPTRTWPSAPASN